MEAQPMQSHDADAMPTMPEDARLLDNGTAREGRGENSIGEWSAIERLREGAQRIEEPEPRVRRERRRLRKAAKVDPDAGLLQAADEAAKSIGGRPKGKKTRPAAERIAENVGKALAAKGVKWWDRMMDEYPYISTQLLKHLVPPAVAAPTYSESRTLTLTFADEGPTGTRIDSPEARRYAELLAPATPPAIASEGIDPAQPAPAAPMQHAASCCPTIEAAETPSVDAAPASVDALLRLVRMGDPEAEAVVNAAARKLDAERATRERDKERKRVEREREANRQRMYRDDACWH